MSESVDPNKIIKSYQQKSLMDSDEDSFKEFSEHTSKLKYFKRMSQQFPKLYNKVCQEIKLIKFKRGQNLYFKDENPEGVYILLKGKCAELEQKTHTEFYNDLQFLKYQKQIQQQIQLQNELKKKQTKKQKESKQTVQAAASSQVEMNAVPLEEPNIPIIIEEQEIDTLPYQSVCSVSKYFNQSVFIYNCKQLIPLFHHFGELELLWKNQRKTTLLCLEEAQVIFIHKSLFRTYEFIKRQKLNSITEFMQHSLFKGVPDMGKEYLFNLYSDCQQIVLIRGNSVYRQGDSGQQYVYVIKQGEVEVTRQQQGQLQEIQKIQHLRDTGNMSHLKLLILQQGEVFGEMELMNNMPRDQTVTCVSDQVKLIKIDKKKYVKILLENQDISDYFEKRRKMLNNQYDIIYKEISTRKKKNLDKKVKNSIKYKYKHMRVIEELLDQDQQGNNKNKKAKDEEFKTCYSKKLILSMNDMIKQNVKIERILSKKNKKKDTADDRLKNMMKMVQSLKYDPPRSFQKEYRKQSGKSVKTSTSKADNKNHIQSHIIHHQSTVNFNAQENNGTPNNNNISGSAIVIKNIRPMSVNPKLMQQSSSRLTSYKKKQELDKSIASIQKQKQQISIDQQLTERFYKQTQSKSISQQQEQCKFSRQQQQQTEKKVCLKQYSLFNLEKNNQFNIQEQQIQCMTKDKALRYWSNYQVKKDKDFNSLSNFNQFINFQEENKNERQQREMLIECEFDKSKFTKI